MRTVTITTKSGDTITGRLVSDGNHVVIIENTTHPYSYNGRLRILTTQITAIDS